MSFTHHKVISVKAWEMYTYMYMYIYFSVFVHASCGQMVTVIMKPTTYAEQGTAALLMCNYSVNDTFYTFNFLQWNKETDLLASFMKGSMQPYYPPEWGDKYSMTTDSIDSSSVLTVSSVQFPSDEGRYICRTQFRKAGTGAISNDTSTLVNVIVLPTSITLSDSTGTYPSTGGKAYLVEGVNHLFNCTVPGVNPRASFSWSVGSRNATEDNSNDIVAADGLTTSSSTVTLSPVWSHHGETMLCQASNKDGHAGISGSLTLDIKVPPKTSSMTLSDTNGALTPGGTAMVDQDASHVFTCQAQSRPEATIQWDLGSNSYQQSTIGPATGGPGDGLVYTTSMWTFTPGRDNHRQQVKCEANTTESQSPYPSVIVTLNVNGPPDVADIRGNQSMSENVTTALTCTADMGYPDNWNLVWSNGGSPINGPNTASSASGSRFIFTSTLNLTPRRQDNGNTISCAARRGSWTAAPQQTLGPLDVAFCTKGVSVMSHPNAVIEGNTISWSCISASSNPATEWTWFKNGTIQSTAPTTEETDGDYHGKRSTATFMTNQLVKMDNGAILICCAKKTTQCTTDVCSSSILNVQYAPTFSPPSQSPLNPVLEGGEVLLTCSLDANPNPSTIIWEKQGPGIGPTPDLSVYRNGTSNLTLSNIKRQQAGNYRCKANNGIPDGTYDAVSSEVTVIVHYEVNITNKADNMEGANDRTDVVLTCIARGNPEPVMVWYDTNGTDIGNSSRSNSSKFIVAMEVSDGDEVYGYEVTSNLTIKKVDSQVDYGVYICDSSNGIGKEDKMEIILIGTRLPDMPGGVKITNRTAASLTVVWSGGFDGGEEQSFRVSYLKTSDSKEVFSDQTGGRTTSTATGLDEYTEYEIRVYAKNIIGENNKYASIKGYTLPNPPGPDTGIIVEYNTDAGTVKVTGLRVENSCIQLEVKYEGNDTWQECGECIASNRTVTLSEWCAVSQTRRRRAIGGIEDVRAKLCIGGLCSEAAPAKQEGIYIPKPNLPVGNTIIIVGVLITIIVVLVIIIVLGVYAKRKFRSQDKGDQKKMEMARNPRPATRSSKSLRYTDTDAQSPYQEKCELDVIKQPVYRDQGVATYSNVTRERKAFPRDQLKMINELGHGAFGLVLLAEARGVSGRSEVTLVAVKTLKDGASKTDKDGIMKELDLMKKLPDHCNVVRLLGFCTDEDPPYIIVEYLSRGNLKDLLRDSRSKGGRVYGNLHGISKSLTSKDLMKFAKDVADGMTFISSQQCIHRDLAARNVLVAEDMVCKVSDFGLARDVMNVRVYERGSEGALPMRWMALESLLDDFYTTESDVWSFGVLLWEIVTLGARPYPAMTAKMMVAELQSGYRMPKPQHCQEELYEMMLRCWDEDPESRPTFKMISQELEGLINKGKEYISVKNFQESIYEVVQPEDKEEKV